MAKREHDMLGGDGDAKCGAFFEDGSLLLSGDMPGALPCHDLAGAFAKCAGHRPNAAKKFED